MGPDISLHCVGLSSRLRNFSFNNNLSNKYASFVSILLIMIVYGEKTLHLLFFLKLQNWFSKMNLRRTLRFPK